MEPHHHHRHNHFEAFHRRAIFYCLPQLPIGKLFFKNLKEKTTHTDTHTHNCVLRISSPDFIWYYRECCQIKEFCMLLEVYLSFSIFPNLDDLLFQRTYLKKKMKKRRKKNQPESCEWTDKLCHKSIKNKVNKSTYIKILLSPKRHIQLSVGIQWSKMCIFLNDKHLIW